MKLVTILGTRPEIIRLSVLLPKLDKYFDHVSVFSNQSYDFELSEIFFKELKLRKPDYRLNVKSNTLSGQIANILTGSESLLMKIKPDGLLILGDTNTSLAAIIARRLKIPVFHLEAGNRAFDWEVPEEINRRIVDHISNYNFAYTEHARRFLINEGIPLNTIFVTGSPMAEVFNVYKDEIKKSTALDQLNLKKNHFFIVSIHREENVDYPERLQSLFNALNHLVEEFKLPIIVSLHPRTRLRLAKTSLRLSPQIIFHKPFGYFDYNQLQMNSLCSLSDSGTIQEESAILNFCAIQVRKSTERPEAFDTGSITLAGHNKNVIVSAIKLTVNEFKKEGLIKPLAYKDLNFSTKVTKLILGLLGTHVK